MRLFPPKKLMRTFSECSAKFKEKADFASTILNDPKKRDKFYEMVGWMDALNWARGQDDLNWARGQDDPFLPPDPQPIPNKEVKK